jgi:hypothetical protein
MVVGPFQFEVRSGFDLVINCDVEWMFAGVEIGGFGKGVRSDGLFYGS